MEVAFAALFYLFERHIEPDLGAVSEFARTMVTDFPIQSILDRLVERIIDVPPITAAGVTLISPGVEPRYIAASDDAALRYEMGARRSVSPAGPLAGRLPG